MSLYFPVCTPSELDTPSYVPVSALIAGDTSGSLVPLYSAMDCPEKARFDVSTYLTSRAPGMFVPLFSNRQAMMTAARSVAQITAGS